MSRVAVYGSVLGVKMELNKIIVIDDITKGNNLLINIDERDIQDNWLSKISDLMDSELRWIYSVPLRLLQPSSEETSDIRYPFPIDTIANKWTSGELIRQKYSEQSEVNANELADKLLVESNELFGKIITFEIRLLGQRPRSSTSLMKPINERAASVFGVFVDKARIRGTPTTSGFRPS